MKSKIKDIENKNTMIFKRLSQIAYVKYECIVMFKNNNNRGVMSKRSLTSSQKDKGSSIGENWMHGSSLNFALRKKNADTINYENVKLFKRLYDVKPTYSTNQILNQSNYVLLNSNDFVD